MQEEPTVFVRGEAAPERLAVEAWKERTREPRLALSLALDALDGGAQGMAGGLALAARAVASLALDEPAEALAAAKRALVTLRGAPAPAGDRRGSSEEWPVESEETLDEVTVDVLLSALRAAFLLEDPVGAARYGQDALALAEAKGFTSQVARVHSDLAAVYGSRDVLDVALRHLTAGVAALEQAGLPVAPALLNNLGNVYLDTSRVDEALACFTRARETFQDTGDPFGAALARSNEGRAYMRLGRFALAVEALEEALAALNKAGNRTYGAATLAKIAQAHAAAGDERQAAAKFEEAIKALRPDHDPWEGEVRAAFGEHLLSAGRASDALRELERAERLFRTAGTPLAATDLKRQQAAALANLGRFKEAYERLADYLSERERGSADRNELLLRLLLVEFEAGLGAQHELHVVARQAIVEANRSLREQAALLEGLSITDELTELFNRRYFRRRLQEELVRARRDGSEVVVLLVDVDHFKHVNDSYSHTVGDAVLTTIAGILRRNCRASDVVARWGGEEFAVLMPGTTRATAFEVAERARRAVAEHSWRDLAPGVAPGLALTVSIGVASTSELQTLASGDPEAQLQHLVDERLYRAKDAGRNRTVAAADER